MFFLVQHNKIIKYVIKLAKFKEMSHLKLKYFIQNVDFFSILNIQDVYYIQDIYNISQTNTSRTFIAINYFQDVYIFTKCISQTLLLHPTLLLER